MKYQQTLDRTGEFHQNLFSLAGWQSGYAAACKAVDAGSIPTSASRFKKPFIEFDEWLFSFAGADGALVSLACGFFRLSGPFLVPEHGL